MGEKEWYFFSLRDRKYPTGVRTNRATNAGYWKTTGKDKEIFNSTVSELVGMKKTLVFYKGRAPRGEKTNWVIHEYRNQFKSSFKNSKDEWVVCRVFQKGPSLKKYPSNHSRLSNPYNNVDILASASVMPSTVHQHSDPYHASLGIGRNCISTGDLAELTRVLRDGNHSAVLTNIPVPVHVQQQQQQQLQLQQQSFTLSGLNLNLSAQRPMSAPFAVQRQFAGEGPPPASLMTVGGGVGLGDPGSMNGSHEINQGHAGHGKYQVMEQCMGLDGYWAAY